MLERDLSPAQTLRHLRHRHRVRRDQPWRDGATPTATTRRHTAERLPPTMTNSDGGVGTNGNLTISGNVTVNGNLDTPRTGVGTCSAAYIDGVDRWRAGDGDRIDRSSCRRRRPIRRRTRRSADLPTSTAQAHPGEQHRLYVARSTGIRARRVLRQLVQRRSLWHRTAATPLVFNNRHRSAARSRWSFSTVTSESRSRDRAPTRST